MSQLADVLVTATSFMKSRHLRDELESRMPSSSSVRYLDLREASDRAFFEDQKAGAAVRAWLVGGEPVTARELALFPQLDTLSKYGVGLDNIDFAACRAAGVTVYFEPGVNSVAVAEHTLGLILALCRNIARNSRMMVSGQWNKDGGRGLQGMKVGLIGLGHVGSKVAVLLSMLGAEVSYCDIIPRPELESSLGIQPLDYQSLLSQSELLSFHVPLTDETRNMMGERELSQVRQGVFIINTSRGEVIDQKALKSALASGHIGGAALDVFEREPLRDKDLAESPGFIGTPHTAGNSEQAVKAMGMAAIRGIQSVFSK